MAFRSRLNVLKSNKILAILVVVILLIIALVILAITDRLQPLAPLIISCIVAICAIISAALASQSLKKTEEALELTRITMRPFLALQPSGITFKKQGQSIRILEFHVKNTGPVPANLVAAEIDFFDDAEVIEDDNRSKHYPAKHEQLVGTVIFPGDVHKLEQTFHGRPSTGNKLLSNMVNGKVKMRFRVTYSAQGREYVTVQTEKLEKEVAGTLKGVKIQPQRWT